MLKGNVRYKNWKNEGFPLWLRQRMEERNLNASQLASKMGVVSSLISRWMTGAQRPNSSSVRKISEALGVDHKDTLIAAGYLPPDAGTSVYEDPRRTDLIRIIRTLSLSDERYHIIRGFLHVYGKHPTIG